MKPFTRKQKLLITKRARLERRLAVIEAKLATQ